MGGPSLRLKVLRVALGWRSFRGLEGVGVTGRTVYGMFHDHNPIPVYCRWIEMQDEESAAGDEIALGRDEWSMV